MHICINVATGKLLKSVSKRMEEEREQECARICDVVRKHPRVWHKNYSISVVDIEWQIIAEELGEEKSEVRRKWCMYRDAFVEDMKTLPKLQPGQNITEYLKPEYKTSCHFKFCLFLGDPSKSELTHEELNDKKTRKETMLEKELKCARITDAVRKHPFIWYEAYPERNNHYHTRWQQEWQKVAAEVGEKVSEVKRLWAIYRNISAAEMKRLPKLKPDQDITEYLKPEYKIRRYFKYCLFLVDPSKSGLTHAELNGETETDNPYLHQELTCACITDVVRQHPIIWYKSHPERQKCNYARFNEEWDQVAAEVGENRNEVRKQWFMYQDSFVNDMKRLPKLQPGQDITEYLKPEYVKSRYFQYCLFLKDPSKSGLTPAQLNGEEPITYETNRQNVMPQNNEEPNVNDDNGLEAVNIGSSMDIEDDECMSIDAEIKREIEQAEEEFLLNSEESVHEIKYEPQTEFNDTPVTNCNDNTIEIDLKNIKSEIEPILYGNTNDIDGEVEGEQNIEFQSNKDTDLSMEDDQHHSTLEEYTNTINKNNIDIMDSNCSESNNVERSPDNHSDDDDDETSLFLRSLLPYLRQLNAIEQMQVRIAVLEIVTSAFLNKNS